MRCPRFLFSILVLAALHAVPLSSRAQGATPAATGSLTVVASGLTNPRGFGWGADGTLYLTQAGHGGDTHIAAGPGFTVDSGLSGSIVTVAGGCVTPVVQGLVSTLWEEATWVFGVMDVAVLDGKT